MVRKIKKKAVTENEKAKFDLEEQLSKVYTPGNPINDSNLFSGRQELLNRLRSQLLITGTNFIFYGERGVGKTSFCNVLFTGYMIHSHTCSRNDDFVTIFLNILSSRGLQFTETENRLLAEAGYKIGSDNLLSVEGKISAGEKEEPIAKQRLDLNFVLKKLAQLQTQIDAIVLDEFQNIKRQEIQTEIIEVVKGLADTNIKLRIVIVGIADSDTQLLTSQEYPQYKMRHFIAEKIPKMGFKELQDIIDKREQLFGIKFEPEVKRWVAEISSGYPQYAHKLALYSCYSWVGENIIKIGESLINLIRSIFGISSKSPSIESINMNITPKNLAVAVKQFIEEFDANYTEVAPQYRKAIESSDKHIIQQILLLLAKSPLDAIKIEEIAKSLNKDEAEIKRAFENNLGILVRKFNEHSYGYSFSQLRPYVRSWEYLQHENISY